MFVLHRAGLTVCLFSSSGMSEDVGDLDAELGVNPFARVLNAANALDLIEINEAVTGYLNRLCFVHPEFFLVDNELDLIGITERCRHPFRPAVREDVATD